MRSGHSERGLAEEIRERIGRGEIRHLEDALFHSEDDDPRGTIRFVGNGERLARPREFVCMQLDLQPPFFLVRGERQHCVAERAHEDFLRVECANERDVHITGPVETLRHADALHAAGGAALEPVVRVNLFVLNCDQAAAGKRRRDAQFDFVAGVVLLTIQFHRELCILVERTRDVAAANDREAEAADATICFVPHFEGESPRGIGRQCVTETVGAEVDLIRTEWAFLERGLEGVVAVVLFGQDRDVAFFDEIEAQFVDRDFAQRGIDGDELDRVRAAFRHVVQRAIRLVADDARQR